MSTPLLRPRAAACLAAALLAVGICSAPQASAQSGWRPDRPVTIIVPYSPGGGTDAIARFAAKALQREWAQPVNVENVPGADGLIGTRKAIDAKADGYTLLIQLPSLVLNSHLPGFKGADPATRLRPISIIASMSGVMVANAALPVNTMEDVVRYCRTASHACSLGTTENSARLRAKLLMSDIPSLVVVNYKGGGQLITDLVGNNVNLGLMGLTAVLPYKDSGKLKIVMSSGPLRSPVLPDIQAAPEAGFAKLKSETWYALFAPLDTPPEVVEAVAATVRSIVKDEEMVKSLARLGATPIGNTPSDFAALVAEESKTFGDLVRRFPIE